MNSSTGPMYTIAIDDFKPYPSLKQLLELQLGFAPEQEKFFSRRFSTATPDDLQELDALAQHIIVLADDALESMAKDYVWYCEQQLEEELYFRRHKRYRLSTFQEAYDEVYSNNAYMHRYMNALLFSQLWWSNHTDVILYYRNTFLAGNPSDFSHVEIGPGHGLFLYYAARDPKSKTVEGWDISQSSIEQTTQALKRLNLDKPFQLICQDFFNLSEVTEVYDSVVFSEILEHMEDPGGALNRLKPLLSSNGRLFINMPINSPAPDHLFNQDSPEELADFIQSHGFNIEEMALFPATNTTLERAREKKLTISCAIIATKSA